MKQIAQYQDGRLELMEVSLPQPPPGGILVRTTHSVISPGTEKMKVEQAKMNLLQKARARPDQVRKVLDSARTLGWRVAMEKVKNRLETPTPMGYSAAGVVEAVDPGNTRFSVGDRVAVGGGECAFHAEYVGVPEMLAVKIPAGVENWQGAYTTMAAISMQAVRQADASLGDRVLIIGQGLVGLLATAICKAAGMRVMAVDLSSERLQTALAVGAERIVNPREASLADQVREWTQGYGVDAALVCTAGSNKPVEQAIDALRDRGTMVIVGITDATLEWKVIYYKEIQVRYSKSYGPGRYDPDYEWGGKDYPIGYVKWTEQRNFESCLELMRSGALDLRPMTTRHVPFADCLDVYEDLTKPGNADIGVVLTYPDSAGVGEVPSPPAATESAGEPVVPDGEGRLGQPVSTVDVIGAGNFVKTMLLPHLKDGLALGTVVTNTALSGAHTAQKFGFSASGTDAAAVFSENTRNAVLIGTRHNLHAPMVLKALAANRHVFVEKPLCLTPAELAEIDRAVETSEGSVMVGFNRRFAPSTVEVKRRLERIPGPKTMLFQVCPGKIAPEHWFSNHEESGGRILGEACHFLDFFCFLAGCKPVRVFAQNVWPTEGRLAFPDSVAAQVEFEDGSCGQLVYTAEGDSSFPKEVFTVYAVGLVARCENFQELHLHTGRNKTKLKHGSKGHAEEMSAWMSFLKGQSAHPLPYQDVRESMRLTFGLLDSIREGRPITL